MADKAESMAYIGRCPKCRSIVLATVDAPKRRERVARDVANAIRDGLLVERVTVEYVRENWAACKCKACAQEGEAAEQGQLGLPGVAAPAVDEAEYQQALAIVREHGARVSVLQVKLDIDFSRASRLLKALRARGDVA